MKPFVKSQKDDFVDAGAIAEAVTGQNMRFVPIKTDDQLDLQALHRVCERLVHRRTALINQIRGFLLERGIVFAKGPANLRLCWFQALFQFWVCCLPRPRTTSIDHENGITGITFQRRITQVSPAWSYSSARTWRLPGTSRQ